MPRNLVLTSLRALLRRPLQTGLMVLGIALGVAVVIAIDLANTSARTAFNLSTQTVIGKATHQIEGGPSGIPDAFFRQLRVDWGYTLTAPVVEGVVVARDLDQQPLQLLGVDPLSEAPFRNFFSGGGAQGNLSQLMVEPNTVAIGAGLADTYHLKIGDPLRLRLNDQLLTVTIAAILTPADAADRRALDGLLIADIATAQELLGMAQPGTLSHIDLILTAEQATALAARLPPNLRLAPASEQTSTANQLGAAFQLNLSALSLLALVVGMFLIYNTVMFSVVQRRSVFGTLRTLGVTGGQLFALIELETLLVAAVGALLGVGLGWLLGQGAVRLVTQTINDLYYVVSVRNAPLTGLTVLKGAGLGLGAGLLAALAPALEAARVEPVTVMRRSTLEDRARELLPWIGGAGLLLGATGGLLILAVSHSLVASFGGLFAIVIGLALAVPVATEGLMALASPVLFRVAGVLGRMAARTVVKAISRTSIAIASLMVAVSVTIGVSLMISSFRSTVTDWLGLTLIADVYVTVPSTGSALATANISPALPGQIRNVPGVAAVDTVRDVSVESQYGTVNLSAADTQRRRSAALYRFASGDPQQVWAQMLQGAVIVSEPFAYHHNVPKQGGTVTLQTDRGPHTFPIVGVYYDYSSDEGTILMPVEVYQQYWNDRDISGIATYLAPGADAQQVAGRLRTLLSGTALQVQVNSELRQQALNIFDRTFAITNALRILAVVVAFIGVLSALMALQIERARELATLLALGLTSRQLWKLTLLETGLMGLAAGVLSLPTGFVLALVLIYVINLRSFGWTMQLTVDPWVFVQAVLVSVAAALLAAVYPMRRLLRLPVAAALRQE